jgi:hypothetical protein
MVFISVKAVSIEDNKDPLSSNCGWKTGGECDNHHVDKF